ncbi:hypothetical protein VTJ49DRAFT_2766 [Mycothermus thermophilus]|uniref:Apple domain-containing protein n=1 Tax=Humicola insolens TaxID=85995 RepID=A0ABR3V9I2_HUMIN
MDERSIHHYPRVLPNPFASQHTDPLIHGRNMELAPVRSTFEEQTTNPTPEVATAATSTTTTHIGPYTPSLLLLQQHPHQKFYHHHHTHANPSWDGSWTGTSRTNLYSDSDFSSPFDSGPLVEGTSPATPGSHGRGNGGRGNRGWNGKQGKKRICGVTRFVFWFVVAAVAFVVVVGVSVGVGVGVGLSGSPSTTPTPSPTPTRTVPLPVATAAPSKSMSCPGNDRTLYLAPQNSQKKFLLLCGRDYHSKNGTQELYNSPTSTLEECLELCAMQDGCLGAGWGRSGKVANGKPVCWLKGQLGQHHDAPLWSFLMLDDGSLSGDATKG